GIDRADFALVLIGLALPFARPGDRVADLPVGLERRAHHVALDEVRHGQRRPDFARRGLDIDGNVDFVGHGRSPLQLGNAGLWRAVQLTRRPSRQTPRTTGEPPSISTRTRSARLPIEISPRSLRPAAVAGCRDTIATACGKPSPSTFSVRRNTACSSENGM